MKSVSVTSMTKFTKARMKSKRVGVLLLAKSLEKAENVNWISVIALFKKCFGGSHRRIGPTLTIKAVIANVYISKWPFLLSFEFKNIISRKFKCFNFKINKKKKIT